MGEFIAFRDGLNIQVPVAGEKNGSSLISVSLVYTCVA